MDICTDILFLKFLFYCQTFLKVMRFVVPIGLMLKLSLDFYKGTLSGSEDIRKEMLNLSFKRIVAAIIIFLIPTLINGVIALIEEVVSFNGDYQSCLVNIEYIDYYEELKYQEAELKEQLEKEQAFKDINTMNEKQKEVLTLNAKKVDTTTDGTSMGQTYTNLSEEKIRNIAKICQKEQGNAEGAAKEASLMANRYELLSKNSSWKKKSLYDYVLKSGWWAPANNGSYKSVILKPSVLSAVKKVLLEGRRTLPLYVDEHDWTGDIKKIQNPGSKPLTSRGAIEKKSNYQKDKTVIYNNMGSVYTYYTHAHSGKDADPFGYTKGAKKSVDAMNK